MTKISQILFLTAVNVKTQKYLVRWTSDYWGIYFIIIIIIVIAIIVIIIIIVIVIVIIIIVVIIINVLSLTLLNVVLSVLHENWCNVVWWQFHWILPW